MIFSSFKNMCRYSIDVLCDAMLDETPFKLIQHENYVGGGKKMLDESLVWKKLSSNIIWSSNVIVLFLEILKVFKPI